MAKLNTCALATCVAMLLPVHRCAAESLLLEKISLPPGFSISLYAKGVSNARGMALGKNGTLFVGSKQEGRLYAVVDEDGDHQADRVYVLAENLQMRAGSPKGRPLSTSLPSIASFDSTRSSDILPTLRRRLSLPPASPKKRLMDGNISASDPTRNCMSPSASPAISAILNPIVWASSPE